VISWYLLLVMRTSRRTYAEVAANISAFLALVKIVKDIVNIIVKSATKPSLAFIEPTQKRTTIANIGIMEAVSILM
jgi:hypothetical protein